MPATAAEPAADPQRIELPYARATARREARLETEPEPPAREPDVRRFARVVVEDTGTLKADKVTIRLIGLEALPLEARCDAGNGSWPCGRAGRGALRRLIRGRSVACTEVQEADEQEIAGRCTVANTDINLWLVRYGWARPRDDEGGRLGEALDTAQREGRGQWRKSRLEGRRVAR